MELKTLKDVGEDIHHTQKLYSYGDLTLAKKWVREAMIAWVKAMEEYSNDWRAGINHRHTEPTDTIYQIVGALEPLDTSIIRHIFHITDGDLK